MLGKLLEKIMTMAVLVALGWAAWYVYSHWNTEPSSSPDPAQAATYNCRQALARLAEDYACRDSDACTLTSDESAAMKNRELDIDQNCN